MRTGHPEMAPKLEDYDDTKNMPCVCEVCGKTFKVLKCFIYSYFGTTILICALAL